MLDIDEVDLTARWMPLCTLPKLRTFLRDATLAHLLRTTCEPCEGRPTDFFPLAFDLVILCFLPGILIVTLGMVLCRSHTAPVGKPTFMSVSFSAVVYGGEFPRADASLTTVNIFPVVGAGFFSFVFPIWIGS